MKILPYLSVIQGQKQDQVRRTNRRETESTPQTETRAEAGASVRDIVEIVSLENKRAVSEDPPRDLGAAEAILEKARSVVANMTRQELSRMHRLEGLVHIYQA